MPAIPWKNTVYHWALPCWGYKALNPPVNSTFSPQLENKLAALCKKHHCVGSTILFYNKGHAPQSFTYGYKSLPKEELTLQSYFRLASITKIFLSLGVLTLVDEGKLSLEESLEHFFPFLINPSFKNHPITLRQLLTHTSSIIDGPLYYKSLNTSYSLDQVLRPSSFSSSVPGNVFSYSNLAFGIIGSLIETVTNLSLESFMVQKVFMPLNIKATFNLASLKEDQVCSTYLVLSKNKSQPQKAFDAVKKHRQGPVLQFPSPLFHFSYGAGGMYADPFSLTQLFSLFSNQGSPLFSKDLFLEMVSPSVPWNRKKPSLFYGLGLMKVKNPSIHSQELWGHQGFAYGVAQGLFYSPKTDQGLISLNNGSSLYRKNHLSALSLDLIQLLL